MIAALSCIFFIAESSNAGDFTGYAAIDYRQFFSGPAAEEQELSSGPTLVLEPEYYHVSEDQSHIFTLRGFGRLDNVDDRRSHLDIRQADWVWANNDIEFTAGISKVFWGVTETRHLVDIINQTDAIEDVDGEDKLGQPMVSFASFLDWGTLRFYYLPYFREREFPGEKGRLRGPTVIDTHKPNYANDLEQWHPDLAVRWTHTVGDWDLGLSHFHGTAREPVIRINGNSLTPFYEIIDQTGLDVQYTWDAWLVKLEAIGVAGHGDYFGAVSGGFEYSFYGINDTDKDLGVLIEYHLDGRSYQAPTTSLDHDIFTGVRLAWNDIDDTELLAGVITDTSHYGQSLFAEYNTRISQHWKLEVDARFFSNVDQYDPFYFAQRDDFIQARLAYYF